MGIRRDGKGEMDEKGRKRVEGRQDSEEKPTHKREHERGRL